MEVKLKNNVEQFTDCLWREYQNHNGTLYKERLTKLLKNYNLKLREDKTLNDLKLAFECGVKNSPFGWIIDENKAAEELDKVCTILNWKEFLHS